MKPKTTTQILLFMQLISGVVLLPCHAQVPGQMSKMWFNMESAQGAFSQTLLAYSNFTTDGIDFGYDGTLLNNGATALYTKMGNTKLMIQAKGDFTVDDVEALHYRTNVARDYTLKLHNKTGIFANGQNVYLRDSQTGIVHNLSAGPYAFTAAQGTTEGRFDVLYTTDSILANEKPQRSEKEIIIYKKDNALMVETPGTQISEILIYDVRGRLLHEVRNASGKSAEVTIAAGEHVLIVQVTSVEGIKASKKIIY